MHYKPNFNDPRVIKKIKRALGFISSSLHESKPKFWSTRYIDRYLGQSQHNLSKYLRYKLLICTNHNWSKDNGICKEYIKNANGYNELKILVNKSHTIPYCITSPDNLANEFLKQEFDNELVNKDFVYEDKSDRLWHPLQSIRKVHKKQLFQQYGLHYEYDVECCAFTLIHQYSQQIPEIIINGDYIQGPMDLYLPKYREYLNDRNKVRDQLSKDTTVPKDIIKKILSALLNGAHLSHSKESSINKLVNGNVKHIELLKQNDFIIGLREDIKIMWSYIKPTLQKRTIVTKLGKQRVMPISSKQKAHLYFKLERQVLNSIRSCLLNLDNKHFLEHDGFTSTKKITNLNYITDSVKNITGYTINLKISFNHPLLDANGSFRKIQGIKNLNNIPYGIGTDNASKAYKI